MSCLVVRTDGYCSPLDRHFFPRVVSGFSCECGIRRLPEGEMSQLWAPPLAVLHYSSEEGAYLSDLEIFAWGACRGGEISEESERVLYEGRHESFRAFRIWDFCKRAGSERDGFRLSQENVSVEDVGGAAEVMEELWDSSPNSGGRGVAQERSDESVATSWSDGLWEDEDRVPYRELSGERERLLEGYAPGLVGWVSPARVSNLGRIQRMQERGAVEAWRSYSLPSAGERNEGSIYSENADFDFEPDSFRNVPRFGYEDSASTAASNSLSYSLLNFD